MKFFHLQRDSSGSSASRGFTLIEIIVSLAIFAIVAVVALGALVKIIDVNKKAQTLQSALTNLSFALESMSRELRTGTNYHCEPTFDSSFGAANFSPKSCNDSFGAHNQLIAFVSSKQGTYQNSAGKCNLAYAYLFEVDPNNSSLWTLKKAQQEHCDDNFAEDSFIPLVSSSNISITDFRLNVYPNPYPLVSLYLSGYAGSREQERSYFDVQTAMSPIIP